MINILIKLLMKLLNICLLYVVMIPVLDIAIIGRYRKYPRTKCSNRKYLIDERNRIDIQNSSECSGFSTAYIMRHFNIEADGEDIYNKMPFKRKDGSVTPKDIVTLFEENHLNATYYKGDLEALKNEISKGNPVIVLVRTHLDKKWLHYIPVIGFDDHNVYIAESLQELVNYNDPNYCYNRIVSNSEFMQLWNTSRIYAPLYKNTFFAIHQ